MSSDQEIKTTAVQNRVGKNPERAQGTQSADDYDDDEGSSAMRLLVFCGTRKAIERFDMEPDWEIAVPAYKEQLPEIMKRFCDNPNAKLAVQGKFMIYGWRTPKDTVVLFDHSWPYEMNSAESLQAVARVGRG